MENAYSGTNFRVVDAGTDRTQAGTFRVMGGYQINRWFGLEASWLDLGSATAHYTVDDGAGPNARDGKYKLSGFNISAVGAWPLTDTFSVQGKLGAFVSTLKYSENGTDNLGGPGRPRLREGPLRRFAPLLHEHSRGPLQPDAPVGQIRPAGRRARLARN